MKKLTGKACIAWMIAALTALGLGQTLGLFLTEQETPVTVTSGEPLVVSGTVIRQEQVVYAEFPGFWETELEAQRVSAGQPLLTLGHLNEDTALQERLLTGGMEAAGLVLPLRRGNIHCAIAEMQKQDACAETLMAMVLGEGETQALLNARETLAAGGTAVKTVCAPVGGIFVPVTDGLEERLTPESPEVNWADLPETPVDPLAVGRIITSDTWYFSGLLPDAVAEGETLRGELLSGVFRTVTLRVERAESESGGCRVLLSCSEGIASVAKLRIITIKFLPE